MKAFTLRVTLGLMLALSSFTSWAQCPTSGTITTNCTTTGDLTVSGATLNVNAGVIVTVTGTLRVQGGGTINGTNATFNVGNLADAWGSTNTFNGGTYNATGTFSVGSGGNFTLSNATVNANGATQLYGATLAISNSTLNTQSIDMNLNNISISNSNFTTTSFMDFEEATITNSTFDIGGVLTVNSGSTTVDNSTISAGTGFAPATTGNTAVTMNGGGVLTLNNNTTMNVQGDVTNNEWYIDNSDVTITGSFDNAGAEILVVRNNGTINIGGNFNNTGSGNVTADTDGVITVEGNYDNSGGGNTNVNGGALIVNGTYTGGGPAGGGPCTGGGGGCCGPTCSTLPITLLTFRAQATPQGTQLIWSSLSERNNDYFTLSLSRDGLEYQNITQVAGSGTTFTPRTYRYQDGPRGRGTYYYRLSQTDYDGTTEILGVRTVRIEEAQQARMGLARSVLKANEDVALTQVPEGTQQVSVYLTDASGRQHLQVPVSLSGEPTLLLSQLNLPAGLYLLQGFGGDHLLQEKVVIQ